MKKMEVFRIQNSKYIAKCPECSEIIKFNINYEKYTISVECKNGHNKNNINFQEFNENYIKDSQYYSLYCYNCFNIVKDTNNYICRDCNKLFCQCCIDNHMRNNDHKTKINFIQQYQLCSYHNKKFSFYCNFCKINICDNCKSNHKSHDIKSFIDIIPNAQTQILAEKNIKIFENKLTNILFSLTKLKNEIDERYSKIDNFFNFLLNINYKLITQFNDNYFDYYNFINYNYLLNFIKNENLFDINKYIDYILMRNNYEFKEINFEEDNNIIKSDIKNNEKEIKCIHNYNSLKYLKDNLFYIHENNCLKILEFKDFSFSFNSILSYNFGRNKISSIIPSKYSDTILINYESKKKVQILEYDIHNKSIILSKNEVKEKKEGISLRFNKCIDDKNGNIITSDLNKVSIWQKKRKKDFINICNIKIINTNLFNINKNLFGFQNSNYDFLFYNTDNYELSKLVKYSNYAELIGIINDELIAFNNKYKQIILFINIKYLEIVQIINNDFYSYIKDNYIYGFIYSFDKLTIIKKKYDKNKNEFTTNENIELSNKIDNLNKVLVTDIGYIAICNDKIILFNI